MTDLIRSDAVAPAHLVHVAQHMRADDVRELNLGTGMKPLNALKLSVRMSEARTWFNEDEPIAIAGVAPCSLYQGRGVPWMLGTSGLDQVPLAVARHARAQLIEWQARFTVLENMTHAENKGMVRLLKRIGFIIEPAVAYGLKQAPFCHFHWKAPARQLVRLPMADAAQGKEN